MKKYIIKSLIAIIIASISSATVWMLTIGLKNALDFFAIWFYVLFVALIAWLIFILPILKSINKFFLENKNYKALLPIFATIYAAIVFTILASIITQEILAFKFLFQQTEFPYIAAGVGFVWGILYIILTNSLNQK